MKSKSLKKLVIRILFGIEIVVFCFTYLFSDNGLFALSRLKKENEKLIFENLAIKKEIHTLENEIKSWSLNEFEAEKYAREKLQLAKKDEQIYLIN